MNKINKLKSTIRNITTEELFGVLATSVNDLPYTNLIAFVLQDDLKKLFFPTPKDTKKFKNLTLNKKISFHIHNSKNSYNDTEDAVGITITGNAIEYLEENSTKIKDLYLLKHPHMKEFLYAPNTAFICVDIERYDVVENFQDTSVLEI